MRSIIVTGFAVVAGVAVAAAQQFDMAAIQKWSNAKIVHYRIAGVHSGAVPIGAGEAGEYSQAQVTDGVTVDLDVELPRLTVVGTPKFTNTASQTTGVKSPGLVDCPPPTPKGPFELLEVAKVVGTERGVLELHGTRTFPSIGVSRQWPASCAQQTMPGGTEPVTVTLAVPEPALLAMPTLPPMDGALKIAIAPDRKSFVIKLDGWTWTYTPTVVK